MNLYKVTNSRFGVGDIFLTADSFFEVLMRVTDAYKETSDSISKDEYYDSIQSIELVSKSFYGCGSHIQVGKEITITIKQ